MPLTNASRPFPQGAVHGSQTDDRVQRLQPPPRSRGWVESRGGREGVGVAAVAAEDEQLPPRPHRRVLLASTERALRHTPPGVGPRVIHGAAGGTVWGVPYIHHHSAAGPCSRGAAEW